MKEPIKYRNVELKNVALGDFCLIWGKKGAKKVMVQITGRDRASGKIHMSDSSGLVLEAQPELIVTVINKA